MKKEKHNILNINAYLFFTEKRNEKENSIKTYIKKLDYHNY